MATFDSLSCFRGLPVEERDGLQVRVRSQDPAETHRALRETAALVALEHRAVLRIEGPDAADLLQRVSSQDAVGMDQGAGAPATLLTGKGKLEAIFELHRLGPELFVAECRRAAVETLRQLIDRYVFAERLELEVLDLQGIGVFGPEAGKRVSRAMPGLSEWSSGFACAALDSAAPSAGFVLASDGLAVPAFRVFADAQRLEDIAAACEALPRAGWEDYEALRIDAGFPRFGHDVDGSTLALEAGLDAACDPDKGCYIGQEIVARIRTYGHVNRELVRVRSLEAVNASLASPALIFDEGIEAGRLTSAFVSPVDQRLHGLAMLPAMLDEDVELRVGSADGPAIVRCEPHTEPA